MIPHVSLIVIILVIFIDIMLAIWPTFINYIAMEEHRKNHLVSNRNARLNEISTFFLTLGVLLVVSLVIVYFIAWWVARTR